MNEHDITNISDYKHDVTNISDYKYMKKVVAMTTVFFAEDFSAGEKNGSTKGDNTSQETGMCPRGQTRHKGGMKRLRAYTHEHCNNYVLMVATRLYVLAC